MDRPSNLLSTVQTRTSPDYLQKDSRTVPGLLPDSNECGELAQDSSSSSPR